jgi:hypothetical protein
MTIGTGILVSTILLIIYFVSKERKWKVIGKFILLLLFFAGTVAAAIWGYSLYDTRVQVLNSLSGVKLGMSEVNVTLLKGPPDSVVGEDNDNVRKVLVYEEFDDINYYVIIDGESGSLIVTHICSRDYADKVFGLGKHSTEAAIVEKLGSPDFTSIESSGTKKIISYPEWNIAFEIKKGSATQVCVFSKSRMSYKTEHPNTYCPPDDPLGLYEGNESCTSKEEDIGTKK